MGTDDIFLKSRKVWEDNLKVFPGSKLHFPDENLVRLFSGKYVQVPTPPATLMDHGFGHGNNLAFFAGKGYSCSGCEISSALITEVNNLFRALEKPVDLRQIQGLAIPFEDNSFDIIVSWNVLHYNGTKESVAEVLNELFRVLKKGGVLLLATIHPDSSVLDRMDNLGGGTYLITRNSEFDNREGLKFYVAGSSEELKGLFSRFSEVQTGKFTFDLCNRSLRNASYLIYARK